MNKRYRIVMLAKAAGLSPDVFVARQIEEHKGVSGAAKALDVTEQAVRSWIDKAEMELDVKVKVTINKPLSPATAS